MQIRLYDPSQWSGLHPKRSERLLDTPKQRSTGTATWTWRKNADFCIANGVRPAVGAFIQESLAQIDSVDGLAVGPSPVAKKSGSEVLTSRVSLLITFSHMMMMTTQTKFTHQPPSPTSNNTHRKDLIVRVVVRARQGAGDGTGYGSTTTAAAGRHRKEGVSVLL